MRDRQAVDAAVGGLLRELARDEARLADDLLSAVRSEVPEYARVSDRALLDGIRTDVRGSIRAFGEWAREGLDPQAEALERFRETAVRRADLLIPLDAVVRAATVAQRRLRAWIDGRASATPQGREAALLLGSRLLEFTTAAVSAAVDVYTARERDGDEGAVTRELVDDLLSGRRAAPSAARVLAEHGLDPRADYVVGVLAVRAGDRAGNREEVLAATRALARHLHAAARPLVVDREGEIVVVAVLDRTSRALDEQLAAAGRELAAARHLELLAGVSTPCPGLLDVARGYAEAALALSLARAGERPIVALSEMRLFDYLVSRADGTAFRIVPAEVRRLIDEDHRNEGVLVDTLRAYIDADLNVGRAAAALVVHPNTVHYRLRRVAEITGRNTRRFSHLVDLVTAIELVARGRDRHSSPPGG